MTHSQATKGAGAFNEVNANAGRVRERASDTSQVANLSDTHVDKAGVAAAPNRDEPGPCLTVDDVGELVAVATVG